jgi:chromatin segregation and condensation protein Rec8/ScpA/Scc1 (kleisin family)
MTNADVHEELLRLRKQVDALAATRRRQKASRDTEEEEAAETDEASQADQTIREQIEELTKLVQDEIRDMPALPTLAVFLLGVLVGRYLR